MIILATNRLQIHRAFPPPRARSPSSLPTVSSHAPRSVHRPPPIRSRPRPTTTPRDIARSALETSAPSRSSRAPSSPPTPSRASSPTTPTSSSTPLDSRADDSTPLTLARSSRASLRRFLFERRGTSARDGRRRRTRRTRARERPWARRAGNRSMARAPGPIARDRRRDATLRPCEAS